tara:strand:- start:338 stop:544 length:207 start_codon:yes stop_codon:yes gene_type:complete
MRELRTAIYKLERGQPTLESIEQLRGWAAYVYMTDKNRGGAMLERLAKISQATPQTSDAAASPEGEER